MLCRLRPFSRAMRLGAFRRKKSAPPAVALELKKVYKERMPKIIFQADAHAPDYTKVRFMRRNPDGPAPYFVDVTSQIARLEIEELDDGSGACALLRVDAKGGLVWRTRHPSLEETRWQGRFEYGVQEGDWRPAASAVQV